MKLTDIDLSSLAEVAAAVTLLEHVHRELATGGTPLPELVVNPARETEFREEQIALSLLPPKQGCDETMTTPASRQQAFDRFLAADAEKLRGLGVDPMTAQPLPASERHAPHMQPRCESAVPMDAGTVFGQSAAPLPQSAPASAGVAASPTAPAVPPASGPVATALPALAPLPAPSVAAPAAPVAQPSHAGGVELDADGLPWHESIHAGTKRKNDDGRWTKKRGLNDPALVTRVVAQLRAQMAAGGVTATSPAPHVKAEPVDALKTLAALPQMTLGQLQEAQMLANVTPPVLHVAPTPTTYLDFMTAATVEVQSGRVPIEAFGEVCKSLGGATALSTNPELIPIAWATLKAKYPGML